MLSVSFLLERGGRVLYSKMPDSSVQEFKLETAPFDPRFPNTNQTRYCYQSYLDFHRCQKKRGTNYESCNYFRKVFKSICPLSWIEKWDEQRAKNAFAGNI